MDASDVKAAAELILQARKADRLSALPDALVPASEEDAYAIQDASLAHEDIVGWKVAPASATKGHQCAPIGRGDLIGPDEALASHTLAPEIEAEIGFAIGRDLPAPVSQADLTDAISGVSLAIEVLDSCFADRKAAHKLSALADRQSNAGLVVGPLRADWQDLDLAELRPHFLEAGGEIVRSTKDMPGAGPVMEALLWLANHAVARGRPLAAGQIVITGARVGPIPITPGQSFQVCLDGFSSVGLRRDIKE